MSVFLEQPGVLAPFVSGNRSRAFGAGLDPFAYERVTARLSSLYEWPAAFRAVAEEWMRAGEAYSAEGRAVSAGDAFRAAARWFHFAALVPHPDRGLLARTEAEADAAMRRALDVLDPGAVRVEGDCFAGWLRRPAGTADPVPVALVVPGLDSSKEEFHDVAEALLARGVAVCAIDGPGQGVMAAALPPRADYHRVVAGVLDALGGHDGVDTSRAGVVGLSLGGYYAAVSAAHEPRVRAAVAVSGPYRLAWEELPLFVTDTLTRRCGGADPARDFARRVDLRAAAPSLTGPLLVVEGGTDDIPGVESGASLAEAAPGAELLTVPHGDHLLGNARPDWLPRTADWLTGHLVRPHARSRAATTVGAPAARGTAASAGPGAAAERTTGSTGAAPAAGGTTASTGRPVPAA
ncbi:S9 family peptidase [Streptomyces sp. TRM49041]|uniref:alpha/beta hydrolase family protein n=1 Tax=Streptomyces sp. TRM49041 TaxID=2603216 RepID=UPI0011F05BAB|nr:alpha/beta hydrolase [Streptomyces sp. TRM49041]